jgi:hypothetical protein
MSATNTDGTPRKSGSGRKAGATSFVELSLAELNAKFADISTPIVVGRMWAQTVGFRDMVTRSAKDMTTNATSQTGEHAADVTVRELD